MIVVIKNILLEISLTQMLLPQWEHLEEVVHSLPLDFKDILILLHLQTLMMPL